MIGALASLAGLAVGYGLAVGLKAFMDGAGFDLGFDGVVMATGTVVIAMVVGVGVDAPRQPPPRRCGPRGSPRSPRCATSAVDSTSARRRAG